MDKTDLSTAAATAPIDPNTPPRWDVSVIYPSLESPEFDAGFTRILAAMGDLQRVFDEAKIGRMNDASPVDADAVRRTFETVLHALSTTLEEADTLRAYIAAFVSTDSRNALAQAKMSELRRAGVGVSLLMTRLSAWVGSIDLDTLLGGSEAARAVEFPLRRMKIWSEHLLPQGEEELLAGLSLSGGSAWGKLHGDITSQLTVPFDGEALPMSVIRGMASNEDRDVRERAYRAEIATWERTALPLCAAMNGIKYESNLINERRGWGDILTLSLYNNRIDRPTLDAMMGAARAAFPDFRRYLRAKARAVSGDSQLAWYDLFAPLGEAPGSWAWPTAASFIETQFGAYSEKLRGFAARAFRENWIDAEPRPGKRDGAFCMGLRRGESRIMQNYKPAFDGVSTLAHELGHGYHNLCLGERSYLQRATPSTLAETASIFCETIVRGAVLKTAGPAEQLSIIEDSLQGSCQVVVDITSRFLFEERVLLRRHERELSVDEMCEIMRDAQRETYGDGLQEATLHPYMWAVKGHYYGSSFYNYPYMFGLLFGLGLYAIYGKDPQGFQPRYDDLLSRTGMADARTLARGFDIDLHDSAFWTASFDHIRGEVDRFEALTASLATTPAA